MSLGEMIVSPAHWLERAMWFRSRGDLDAAHRCELRAEALLAGEAVPLLLGYL